MIIDQLKNNGLYRGIHERIDQAFAYLLSADVETMPVGKYEIAGDDLYAVVLEYVTKPVSECPIEAHRKYADVQYLFSGKENIGIASRRLQAETTAYHEEKDYAFFASEISLVYMQQGMFAVFFPDDLHAPGIQIAQPEKVKKIVVKVRLPH